MGFLPRDVKIVGYARTKMDTAEYHKRITSYLKVADDDEDGHRGRRRDDDEATLVGGASRGAPGPVVGEDAVVFEIGDEDDEDDDKTPKKREHAERLSGEQGRGDERQGLMRDRDD